MAETLGVFRKQGEGSLGLKRLATHSSQYLLGSKIPADTDRTRGNSVVARRSTAFHLAYLSKFVSETFVTGGYKGPQKQLSFFKLEILEAQLYKCIRFIFE